MAQFTIATFNVENLLQRFNFHAYGRLTVAPALRLLGIEPDNPEYMPLRQALSVVVTDDSRQMTAQAIRETGADLLCLQEVDNDDVLDDFHDQYLKKSTRVHYGWRRLIEGNDRRGIDVAVMSRTRITVRSHAHHTFDDFGLFNQELDNYGLSSGARIFRRDCLEIEINVDGNPLTVFNCHFKSMSGGRAETRPVREAEAAAVRRIVEDRFGDDVADSRWLVVGDLNDYVEADGQPDDGHALGALLDDGFSVNLLGQVDAAERWTHYYPTDDAKRQLDYILASPRIAAANRHPEIRAVRGGQPYRVSGTDAVNRYPRVGFDRPKASDHCPLVATLEV